MFKEETIPDQSYADDEFAELPFPPVKPLNLTYGREVKYNDQHMDMVASMLESGAFSTFPDLFSVIAKTALTVKANFNFNRFKVKLAHPQLFRLGDIYRLASFFNVTFGAIYRLLHAQITTNCESLPVSPGILKDSQNAVSLFKEKVHDAHASDPFLDVFGSLMTFFVAFERARMEFPRAYKEYRVIERPKLLGKEETITFEHIYLMAELFEFEYDRLLDFFRRQIENRQGKIGMYWPGYYAPDEEFS
jgi:hypothetical protein